jgi:predicted dehydrogenase/threonine dehydrogenase-like Zn-dependent dehydrogenase
MKQVIRRVIDRKGKVIALDLPEPHLSPDQVLIRTHYTLISSGTEMSTLSKTPQELVRQTISDPWMRHVVKDTILTTGLSQTGRRVLQEMWMPRQIGYSGAGRVLAVGANTEGVKVGDPVAYAAVGHAELAAPFANHVVPVPEGVDLRHAAFVTVGGIALHAIRRAELQLGEVVAVYGLGLVGQLCARIAKAAGCVVIGIDVNEARCRLARDAGLEHTFNPASDDLKRRIMDVSNKQGADATIICASAKSSDIVNSATEITRRQGRVVIVGYVGLDIHPKNFLFRELDIRYSRAYGPGSYDNGYEKGRVDYPFGYVRWTEKRNLGEVIRLIATGALEVEPLIGETFKLPRAQDAFDAIANGTLKGVAALLEYDVCTSPRRQRTITIGDAVKADGKLGVSIVGVGNHVLSKHLPNLKTARDVQVRYLVSASGRNASMVAKNVGAVAITSDLDAALADPETDLVMICSSHPEHGEHILRCIDAGKAVFVEKPMVTTLDQFKAVEQRMATAPVPFTVGLNRRYSPMLAKLADFIGTPVDAVDYMITQPFTPPDHWTLDAIDGGGRLISQAEHFIDVCLKLVGREPIGVMARALGEQPDDIRTLCDFALTIDFDEAVGNIVFNESSGAGFPRERITAMGRGKIAVLDDFATLTTHGRKSERHGFKFSRQMGHKQALRAFLRQLRGEDNDAIGWPEASRATMVMFAAQESIRSGERVNLQDFRAALWSE